MLCNITGILTYVKHKNKNNTFEIFCANEGGYCQWGIQFLKKHQTLHRFVRARLSRYCGAVLS